MSLRGRGLLEIKPSSNPFFQSTTSDIGANPADSIQWKVDGKAPPFQAGKHNVDGNFSFLYSRESDRIGAKVAKPVMKDTKLLTKTEFLKKKREEFAASSDFSQVEDREEKTSPSKRTAEDVLAVYKHVPKYEDPRYTTSMVSIHSLLVPIAKTISYGNISLKIHRATMERSLHLLLRLSRSVLLGHRDFLVRSTTSNP